MIVRSFPPLHAIVDVTVAGRAGWEPAALAAAYLTNKTTFLQVRAKDMASAPLLALCQRIVALARPCAATVIVNDRVDVAKLAGAAGVHVGQEDLSPADARAILGPDAIVGYSTHTLAQVQQALREPVSYLAVGPVFGTTTKDTGYDAVGLDLVAAAAQAAGACPIVSIGGITLDNAPSVLAAGATSVAVIGDLLATGDPQSRVSQYVRQLARHRV